MLLFFSLEINKERFSIRGLLLFNLYQNSFCCCSANCCLFCVNAWCLVCGAACIVAFHYGFLLHHGKDVLDVAIAPDLVAQTKVVVFDSAHREFCDTLSVLCY